jgi:hypothetical protein
MRTTLWLLIGLVTAGAGCGGRGEAYENRLLTSTPIVVGHHLAFLDQTRERVTLVRPYTREVTHVDVGRQPSFMLPTPDGARLIVICKGWVATERDEADEPPSMVLIDPNAPTETVSYDLGSPFDEVAVSPDSRFAVAFFSSTSTPGVDEVFRNPNAVALLDLNEPGSAPMEKTVRSFGDVPLGVLFSPPEMAPLESDGALGTPRTVAVVFADGYVTFLDMEHPERSEVTVHLTLPDHPQTVIPQEIVFAPEAGTIFLRCAGANDIYAFTLTARSPADSTENDFVISINTLAAGSIPADVGVFTDGGDRKILVANQGSQDLTIIDALTSEFVNIPIGDPVDRVLLYPEIEPTVAVIFSQGSTRTRIHFLDLPEVETQVGQNHDVLTTNEPVQNIELIPGRDQALVLHNDTHSVMSVLDLTQRTLSPITAQGELGGYVFTADGAHLAGFTYSTTQVGLIDLSNLAVRTLQLTHAPMRIFALQADVDTTDAESRAVVVDHGDPAGRLSVIPNPSDPSRTSTFVLSGFLYDGLLDNPL